MVLSMLQTFRGVKDKEGADAECCGNKSNLTMSGSARGSSATQAEGTKEEKGQLKQEEASFSKSNIREGITSLLCTTGSTLWRYLISPLKMRASFPHHSKKNAFCWWNTYASSSVLVCLLICSTIFKAFQTLSVYHFFPSFFITGIIFVPFFCRKSTSLLCPSLKWCNSTSQSGHTFWSGPSVPSSVGCYNHPLLSSSPRSLE